MSGSLEARIQKAKAKGKTVTLKIKYSDFKSVTRSITVDTPTADISEILNLGLHLLEKLDLRRSVRLVGIGISNLIDEDEEAAQAPQLSLEL